MTGAGPADGPPRPGEAAEVAPGILWLRLPLPMALDHVNVYALDDGDGWTVVDTGLDTRESRAIWQDLLAGPLREKALKRIVVTHHHPDHVGLAGWLQGQGAALWTTRTAFLLARMLTLDVQERPVAQALAFWRAAGMPEAEIAGRAAERPFNFADVVAPIPPGHVRLKDGDGLTMGGRRWIVRMGDGHAPEHATFWCEDEPLVIGGDQFLPGITPNIGVYATEPDADPLGEWLASCAAFGRHARPGQLVLPGHRRPFAGLPDRLQEMIAHHRRALDLLEAALDEPRTAIGCFPVLYRRPIGPGEQGLALAEAVAHLNHLLRSGRATREMGPDGAWLWRRAG
ncbi:MAG: MBL fold metallo-hydrolase [Rhodobacteraceae bacterium]|nr:MBL fold metallo-hydrolase [Paracoccaceae bacterium]